VVSATTRMFVALMKHDEAARSLLSTLFRRRFPGLLATFPDTGSALIGYTQAVMRGPSAFSPAERELLATYVSGLNTCGFCTGVHRATAQALDMDPDLLDALLTNLDTAPVDEHMRPVLSYARSLTLTPARVSAADADAVLAAGWPERALHDTASVCGLLSLFNRLIDGLGITVPDGFYQAAATPLAGPSGYTALLPPDPADPPAPVTGTSHKATT
jgi:uncharacterized peroxidase-related enzyme